MTSGTAVRRATLSSEPLRALDPTIPPWPGEQVRVAGTEVFVRHTPGPADGSGAPALYLHGLGGASTNWTDLAYLLADRLDADAPDLPGFGRSGPPPGRDYSLAAQVRLAAALIERRDRGPVHLLGNSMGGAVAVLLAAARPDLVSTLTLISPAMPALRPRRGSDVSLPLLLLPGLDRLVGWRMSRMSPEARVRALITLCYADPGRVPPNRLAEAADEVRRRSQLPWATESVARALRGLVGSYLVRGPGSLWRQAAWITAPTLVIWGIEDKLVDVALAPRTAAAIQDARLLVLPRIGHTAQLEDPETVARAFLGLLAERG